MCFETRGIGLHKSCTVERVEDAGKVFNMGGKENGGVGQKKGYIYSSFCNFLVQLVLLINKHKMAQPLYCTTTRRLMNEKPPDKIENLRRGKFTLPGVAVVLHTTFTTWSLCISE